MVIVAAVIVVVGVVLGAASGPGAVAHGDLARDVTFTAAAPAQPPEPEPPEPGTPCEGPGCILGPAPDTTTGPEPGVDPAPVDGTGTPPAAPSCDVFNLDDCISSAINSFLRALVIDALNPMLELLSDTLLTTPSPGDIPQLVELWTGSWDILLATYGLLILAAGLLIMGYETVQTRHTLREIAPRIVVGFLAGALSLTLAGLAIDTANALSHAVLTAGIGQGDSGAALGEVVTVALTLDSGAIFLLLMGLVMAAVLLALLLSYIVRVAIIIVLVAGAPIALMFHALPHTEGIARWWWRTFGACLAIQVVQSLTLVTALQVLLAPDGGFGLFGGTTDNGFVTMLITLALLYILFKIPSWMLSGSRIGQGRSLLGSLMRGFVAYKTFGLLSGRSGGARRGPGGGGGGGGGGRGPRPTPSPSDPYTRARATSDGQLMLPLDGLTRRRPRPGLPGPPPQPKRRPDWAGRQLALPLEERDWPENRPILAADGQYRLPLRVSRTPATPVPPPTSASRPTRSGGGRQLSLPLAAGDWPENRPVLGADGQYRLPIAAPRTRPAPRPATPPAPTGRPTRPAPGHGRQLELKFDPFHGNRPLRGGQYPLPLEGLTSRPRPPASTTTPPAAPAGAAPPRQASRGRQLSLPLTPPRAAAPPTPAAPDATPRSERPTRRRVPPAPASPPPTATARVPRARATSPRTNRLDTSSSGTAQPATAQPGSARPPAVQPVDVRPRAGRAAPPATGQPRPAPPAWERLEVPPARPPARRRPARPAPGDDPS